MPTAPAIRLDSDKLVTTVVMENDLLKAVILPDKGADIYQLIYKPQNIDVLWKTPWGLKRPGIGVPSVYNSAEAWLETYPGGWQEIFPSGGGPCTYKGAELGFHGEASMTTWNFEISPPQRDVAEVRFFTRLARSPFRIERVMRLEGNKPILLLRERITNEGDESMDYMWGHHPAYGEPFLTGDCRIDVGAKTLLADDEYDKPLNPLTPDRKYQWPHAERDGKKTDLSKVPPRTQPQTLYGYLLDFDSGWYGITNTKLGFGVGMTWPIDVFPCAWLWQELSASSGYPWYCAAHTMAIEPFTSYPGQGLVKAMEKSSTHKTLKPGESVNADVRFIFYESKNGIQKIKSDGTVVQREQ